MESALIMNRAVLVYAATLAGLSLPALAQVPPQYPDARDDQTQPYYQQQQPPGGPHLSPQDLSNLVAPIALYPDMLLSEVLAASTYPAEITQAQQWMQSNPGLRGQQLVEAAKQQNWDPSVQALVAFPDVMNMLTRDIQWTTDLGNAFLAQQADVMDAIQRLRASARDNGRLANTPQQRVTYEQANGQNAIVIQPTDPQVIYPPVYNPVYVWGPPVYGVYPPLGYPAVGYGISYAVGTFLGAMFSGLLSFGGWGWGLSWLSHGIFLNGLFFSHFGFHGYGGYGYHGGYGYAARAAWVHNPGHRLGVPYGNRYTAARYGGGSGSRGWSGSSSQNYRANNSGGSYNTGHSGYAGSSNQGRSRQMEAYRGLSASASRGGGSGYSQSRYSTPSYGASPNHFSGASPSGYRGGSSPGRGGSAPSSHYSAPRSSGGRSSSPHYSAPKSSSHSGGGGGHSGGHSHSSGGGHSHGGSHKK